MDQVTGSLEKVSANLELAERKRNSLRKAVVWLTLESKEFEEHMESTQESFKECFNELEAREKHLNVVEESISESKVDLNLFRISIEKRLEEVENKERQLDALQNEPIKYLESKEKQLDLFLKSTEGRIAEIRLREEKLSATQKLVEGLFDKIKLELKKFEPTQKLIDERIEEMGLKEKYIEDKMREIDTIQDLIERRSQELDAREKQLEENKNELELKINNFGSVQEELKLKEKEVELVKKTNEKRVEELDWREEQLDSVKRFNQDCFKDYRLKKKKCQLEQKLVEERENKLQSREKQFEEWVKECEVKEKQLMVAENDIYSADIRLCISMDGKSLQIFLNERERDHDLMADEVHKALGFSLDPAKLILDAMEGFYPPHLKKADVEFEANVVRRSCIILLEQLMRISPQIKPNVRERALRLAVEWKAKMVVGKNSLEVLGFLHLLASYRLASALDPDELPILFEMVVEHRQTPTLCRILGFTEKIPGFIQNFIKKGRRILAIKYIYAFELLDMFPPVILLKNHLVSVENFAKKKYEKEHNSHMAQYRATNYKIAALRAVVKCIADHGLESEYSAEDLKARIVQLERQRAEQKNSIPSLDSNSQLQQQETKTSPAPAPVMTSIAQTQLHDTKEHASLVAVVSTSSTESEQIPALCLTSMAQLQQMAMKTSLAPARVPASLATAISEAEFQQKPAPKRPRVTVPEEAAVVFNPLTYDGCTLNST